MPEVNVFTFGQFFPSIWFGISISLVGLFLAGYFSKSKIIRLICAASFPLILYSYSYFFTTLSSPDIGNVRGMFEVFHKVGIHSDIISYFQYPVYFSLNEILREILQANINLISGLLFAIFGILLAIFLFLYMSKFSKNSTYQIAFVTIPLYFVGLFSFINYQWVPQTLALVFFFLLLFLISKQGYEYKILSIIIFTTLVFTHAFIPTMFLIFFGVYSFKKRENLDIFILMICIYAAVLVYYTTYYFPVIADTFTNTIYSFGKDYNIKVTRSFKDPTTPMMQLISTINRIRVPLVWLVVCFGTFLIFIKKKLDYKMIALGASSSCYLAVGLFYPILGMRALQILLVAVVIGIYFFLKRWKKLTVIFILVILVFSVFGPMRDSYNQTQYQLEEEKNACSYLANKIPTVGQKTIAIGQINWGYFTIFYKYLYDKYVNAYRPGNDEFYKIFNTTINEGGYILYNPNLGKETVSYGMNIEELEDIIYDKISRNKIYQCGNTQIISR